MRLLERPKPRPPARSLVRWIEAMMAGDVDPRNLATSTLENLSAAANGLVAERAPAVPAELLALRDRVDSALAAR